MCHKARRPDARQQIGGHGKPPPDGPASAELRGDRAHLAAYQPDAAAMKGPAEIQRSAFCPVPGPDNDTAAVAGHGDGPVECGRIAGELIDKVEIPKKALVLTFVIERIETGLRSRLEGHFSSLGVKIKGDQAAQREQGKKRRCQDADNPLTEDSDVLANEGLPVHEEIDGRFQIGKKQRLLVAQRIGHGEEVCGSGQKMALVGMESKDPSSRPPRGILLPHLVTLPMQA